MSLSLKRSRLLELESLCLSAFQHKNTSKKLSQQNILHNENFKTLLKQCILSVDDFEVRECIKVCDKLVAQGLIDAKPLLIMAQQILPAASASRASQSFCLSNFAKLLVRLSVTSGNDALVVDFAIGDDRIIPALLSENCNSTFKEFLLGNPELVLKSVQSSKHYSATRLSLLSSLVSCPSDDSFELLLLFLIWNVGRLTFEELSIMKLISNTLSLASNPSWDSNQGRLFAAFLECLIDYFVSYGAFESELISCLQSFTQFKKRHLLKDCSLDGLVLSIPMLVPSCSSALAYCVLEHASVSPSLRQLFSISSLFVLGVHGGNAEIISVFKRAKVLASSPEFDEIQLISMVGKRSCYIRKLVADGNMAELLNGCDSDILFFTQLTPCEIKTQIAENLIQFVSSFITECTDASLNSLLQIWLVEFIEKYLNEFEIQTILPKLCRRTSSNYNLLYAFVQKKLKALDFCSSNSEQACFALSLNALLENSESRQSRINFISSSCLMFLSKFVNGEMSKLDVRNLILVTKILVRLSLILAVDPRMVWSKYFQGASEFPLKLSSITFVQAFKVISNDKDGNIDAMKQSAVQFLYYTLESASQEIELLLLAETFTQIDVPTLMAAYVSMCKCGPNEDSQEFDQTELLKNSLLFCPEKLFNHFFSIESNHVFEKLISHLIDYEVNIMPRPLFVGAGEPSTTGSRMLNEVPSTHPSFFNEFLDQFSSVPIANFDSFIQIFKSKLVMCIPSLPGLLWFTRPLLGEHIMKFTKSMLSSIDDQSLLKSLSGYSSVISSLKGPLTPQFASSSVLAISALQLELYNLQMFSDAQLANGWVQFLIDIWNDVNNPFNRYIQNDDFCCALAVSYSLFESSPSKCKLALADALLNQMGTGKSIKTFASFSYASGTLALLAAEKLHNLQNMVTDGYQLFAYALASCRINLPIAELDLPKYDEWSLLASALLVDSTSANLPSKEPAELKGILTFLKCKTDSKSIENKYSENATSSKPIPASLKFDSVLFYLCSKGLNLITMRGDNHISLDLLKQIYNGTSDAKTRALVDFVASRIQISDPSELSTAGISFERFKGKSPLLHYVCCSPGSKKYRILKRCAIIPRIYWSDLNVEDFDFILTHTISLTPVTKSVYCNQSTLHAFRTYFNAAIHECQFDTRKVIEILFSQLIEGEANTLYNELIAALPIYRLESFLMETLELASLASKLKIQLPSSVDFIAANFGLLKLLKEKRVEFTDEKLSILLDDGVAMREKLTVTHEKHYTEILGRLLHTLSPSDKVQKLIELLDCTFIFESTAVVESLLSYLVSEVDFDYQLKVLLESCSVAALERVSNRIENLSDELFFKFQEVFEIIEFASRPI